MRFWYETSHHPRRRLPEKNRKLLNDSKLLWKTTFYMNQMRIVNVHQEKKRNRPPYACWFCFIIFGDLLVAGTCHIYLATFNTFNAVLVCASSAWLISRWHNDQPLPLSSSCKQQMQLTSYMWDVRIDACCTSHISFTRCSLCWDHTSCPTSSMWLSSQLSCHKSALDMRLPPYLISC